MTLAIAKPSELSLILYASANRHSAPTTWRRNLPTPSSHSVSPPPEEIATAEYGPRERLAVRGVDYQPATKAKTDIYLNLLPLNNSGRVELLDDPRLTSQLCALERRTARGGRDSIDHSPGAHDDVINAAAGAIVMAAPRTAQQVPIVSPIIVGRARTVSGGTASTEAAWCEYAYGAGNTDSS